VFAHLCSHRHVSRERATCGGIADRLQNMPLPTRPDDARMTPTESRPSQAVARANSTCHDAGNLLRNELHLQSTIRGVSVGIL